MSRATPGGTGISSPSVNARAGATQRKAYDLADQLVSSTDYRGKTTKYTWANASQQATATDPDNDVTKQSFDSYGNVASAVDADATTTTFTYDLDGNSTHHDIPLRRSHGSNLRRRRGQTHLHDANQHTTKYSYARRREPIAVTDPLGQVTTTSYTPDGKVLRVGRPDKERGRSTPTTATTKCSRHVRIPGQGHHATYNAEDEKNEFDRTRRTKDCIRVDTLVVSRRVRRNRTAPSSRSATTATATSPRNTAQAAGRLTLRIPTTNSARLTMSDATGISTYQYNANDVMTKQTNGSGARLRILV